MPGWDIDDEESHDFGGAGGRAGVKHYMVVLHYEGLRLCHFIPQHAKRDANGCIVMSSYRKTERMTEEGTPETVLEDKVEKWSTKKDILDGMSQELRGACNSVKTFLSKQNCSVWYHNSNVDECAEFGGAHLHLIVESEQTASGSYKYLFDVAPYRTMKTKCRATKNGYVRVQGVKSVIGAMRHFSKKPRMYIGTNFKSLYMLYKEALSKGGVPVPPLKEVFDDEEESEKKEAEVAKRYSSWDDDGPGAKRSNWDEDVPSDQSFHVDPPCSSTMAVKETPADRMGRLMRLLMERYRANNKSEMFGRMAKLDPEADISYKALWYRLAMRPSSAKVMETTLDCMKSEYIHMPFQELVDRYCRCPSLSDKYETVEDSYKFFVEWATKQGWDVIKLITDTVDIMDRSREKVNTICLVGPSNSGKTVMFSQPLASICRFVGQISNRGAASEFVWQDCINARVIVMDECMMPKEYYEDLKLVFGGETMKVSVKHQGHGTLERTPCILTGNNNPWMLDYAAKVPMMNRMEYYTTREDGDLKVLKKLHPGMWWYLIQQHDINREGLIPLEQLVRYPQVDPCAEISQDDPL